MLDDFKCQVEPATAWVGRCIVSTTIYGKIYGNRFVSEASPSQVDKRRAMQTQPLTPSLRYGQAEVKLREDLVRGLSQPSWQRSTFRCMADGMLAEWGFMVSLLWKRMLKMRSLTSSSPHPVLLPPKSSNSSTTMLARRGQSP